MTGILTQLYHRKIGYSLMDVCSVFGVFCVIEVIEVMKNKKKLKTESGLTAEFKEFIGGHYDDCLYYQLVNKDSLCCVVRFLVCLHILAW